MSDMTRAEALKVLKSYSALSCGVCLQDIFDKDTKKNYDAEEALKIAINSLKVDEQYDLMYEQAEPNCPYYVIDDDGHGLCTNHRYIPTMYYPQVEGITPTVVCEVTTSQEPSGETVSLEAFKQVMWERDTAIAQLKELGYEFGEKIKTIDDKPDTGIRKYRKEARRWKRKYIRVNNQLSKCKKLLENDDIQSHTDEMWEKAKESEDKE